MSQNTNIKCSKCGLVNWSEQVSCKRCKGVLQNSSATSDFFANNPGKVTALQHLLFFFLYILGVALAGVTTGLIFYAGDIFKIISVTYAVVAVAIGFVVPLAGVHYFIENRKTRITGKAYIYNGAGKDFAQLEKQFTNGIPVWLRFIQGSLVLFSAAAAAAVSGQILNNSLPSGEYPVLLLGLPALVVGFATLFITSIFIKAFAVKKANA